MKKQDTITLTGKPVLTRLTNSLNGNARFDVEIDCATNGVVTFRTMEDCCTNILQNAAHSGKYVTVEVSYKWQRLYMSDCWLFASDRHNTKGRYKKYV